MTHYHPDPHGELDWDSLIEIDSKPFESFQRDINIPKILSIPFTAVIENSLGQAEGVTVVQLVEVYADLLESLSENQIQLALRRASKFFFPKVLDFLGKRDITGDDDVRTDTQDPQETQATGSLSLADFI